MIDSKKIENIAKLARLKIQPENVQQYSDQLSKVLNHFDQISHIDTTCIEPLVTPTDIEIFHRDDFAEKQFDAENLLQNAPDRSGNLFKVPPVVC